MTGGGSVSESTQSAPRVVVGVDGSAHAWRALAWAVKEARLHHATLEVVHVDTFRHEVSELFGGDLLRSESAILDRAVTRAKQLEPEVVVTGRLCEPPAAKALVAASEGAEMLVVGSRGLSGLKELTVGSVSVACLHGARCPLVVIHSAGEATEGVPGTG
jgi:nucleotide-binding universal stress UspA family protein